MARRGECKGETLLDVCGFRCICDSCGVSSRCRDYNLFHRDTIFARINGFEVSCSEYEPPRWRGLEGVRP